MLAREIAIVKALCANFNIVVGGALEIKRKRRKVLLADIFTNAGSGPFVLPLFRAGDSDRTSISEGGMTCELPSSSKEQTKNYNIKAISSQAITEGMEEVAV